MKVLENISSGINRVVTIIAMVFLVVLLASSTAQVVSRYAFNASIVWTEELARYCFIWLNLLGTSVLVKTGGHAVVDLFTKKLSPERSASIEVSFTRRSAISDMCSFATVGSLSAL